MVAAVKKKKKVKNGSPPPHLAANMEKGRGHRFQPGHPRYGGRQKGQNQRSIATVMRAFMEILEEGMRVAGDAVEAKMASQKQRYNFKAKDSPESKYMAWLALEKPELYVAMMSRFLPNKVEVDISNEINVSSRDIPTKEELKAQIEVMGLPPTKVFDLVDYSRVDQEDTESTDS